MATTTPQKNTTQSLPTNHKVEPAKAPEVTTTSASVETPKTEATAEPVTKGTTIVSLVVPEKLAKKLRLIARIEGLSMSSIVVTSIEREIPARLKVALASLQDDDAE